MQDFEEESVRTRMIGVFQEWLIQKSSCPVSYKWKDLGDYFWPRWIKQGRCGGIATDPAIEEEDAEGDYDDEDAEEESAEEMSSSPGQNFGCSWPPGMRCGKGKTKASNSKEKLRDINIYCFACYKLCRCCTF